jgi:hypothetical protein
MCGSQYLASIDWCHTDDKTLRQGSQRKISILQHNLTITTSIIYPEKQPEQKITLFCPAR